MALRPAGSGRRRIGLALGGGSALGWAHIGVIRELTAQGVAIDVVDGPSIGAVVAIASGVADEAADPDDGRRTRKARRLLFARRRLFRRRADGVPGTASVMVGAFSIAQERISRARLAIDPPDVMLFARTPGVGLFEFHRAAELIEHGRVVVRRAMPDIEARLGAGAQRR